MNSCGWNQEDWDALILTIKQNNSILMLGPDTVVEKTDGKYQSCTELFANELANTTRLRSEIEQFNIDTSNLAQVSMFYSMKIGRNDLIAKTISFYNKRKDLVVDYLEDLASLPFSFIVSSTPDQTFYNSLVNARKEPLRDAYSFRGDKHDIVKMGTIEKPLLFHLFGTFEEPDSLVLTENDLLDFLVAVVSKKPSIPRNILTELRARDKTLLFLGFGFRRWYLRILLHMLDIGKDRKESRSFALEEISSKRFKELQGVIFFFKESEYKIQICNLKISDFVKELKKRYDEITEPKSSKSKSPAVTSPDAPVVFICHASEDKKDANTLSSNLKSSGLNPWIDKEQIRGGQRWDNLIKNTIEDVDYFVVLQSWALKKKTKGYVNKEISLALEKELEYRAHSFIIPVRIDDSPKLDNLRQFQTIDLLKTDDVEELSSCIKRDYQRRIKGVSHGIRERV